MKISCIIPTKNRENFILRAIQSVLDQRHKVNEIVIVDDGSTDNTLDLISYHFNNAKIIKIIKSSGLGAGKARNLGVLHSIGDIIMFLDSDDEWLKDHSEMLYKGHKLGFEVCFGRTLNKNNSNGEIFYIPDMELNLSGDIFRYLLRWCHLVPSSFSITRRTFESLGGFSGDVIGEDWLFFLRLSEKYDFFFIHDIITLRNFHENSLCQREFCFDCVIYLLKKIEDIVLKSAKTKDEDLIWLKSAMKITQEKGKNWKTVQEWYQGLKMAGLM